MTTNLRPLTELPPKDFTATAMRVWEVKDLLCRALIALLCVMCLFLAAYGP